MQNLHCFEISYLAPTNCKGSRVKIHSLRFNQTIIISYNYNFNSIYDIAENYLKTIGFNCLYLSETKKGYLILSDTFKPLKN